MYHVRGNSKPRQDMRCRLVPVLYHESPGPGKPLAAILCDPGNLSNSRSCAMIQEPWTAPGDRRKVGGAVEPAVLSSRCGCWPVCQGRVCLGRPIGCPDPPGLAGRGWALQENTFRCALSALTAGIPTGIERGKPWIGEKTLHAYHCGSGAHPGTATANTSAIGSGRSAPARTVHSPTGSSSRPRSAMSARPAHRVARAGSGAPPDALAPHIRGRVHRATRW